MKKRLISTILALVMLLTMLPVGAAAAEETVTEEWAQELFTQVGFASMMASVNDRYFAPGETAPDEEVFWLLQMSGDLDEYYNSETWWYELTYGQYMEIVGKRFANHSDMKDYLTKQGYYNAETGEVKVPSGGFGDVWSWVVLSTHQSGSTYKIQGLFLDQLVEDTTGLTENIDYLTYYYDFNGEMHTGNLYIEEVLEMTLQETEDGWKILGYEQGDYYIVEKDGDATLYELDSETREVAQIYSRVRLYAMYTTFTTQGEEPERLEDSLTKFENNDDLWYVSDEGFTWEASPSEGYVLFGVDCDTPAGTVRAGTKGTVEPGTGAVEFWANPDAVIDVDAEHATIEVVQGLREYGDKYLYTITGVVSLKVTADEGYEVVSVSMGNAQGQYEESSGTYVIFPSYEPATLTVTTQVDFTDISEGAYYEKPVQWAVENNITNGTTPTTFSPDEECTRGQVVTFLWRAAGSPEPTSTEHPFTDLDENRFYYKAVLWAVENEITTGATETTFDPNGTCTRSQVATFLWRAAGSPEPEGQDNPFTDVTDSRYYYDAVLWAAENGITQGDGEASTFNPNGKCTRGQIVTFLYRFAN